MIPIADLGRAFEALRRHTSGRHPAEPLSQIVDIVWLTGVAEFQLEVFRARLYAVKSWTFSHLMQDTYARRIRSCEPR